MLLNQTQKLSAGRRGCGIILADIKHEEVSMAFCNKCGKEFEGEGVVCKDCEAVQTESEASEDNASKVSETAATIAKSVGENFKKLQSSSAFKYYNKRIKNTLAAQEDDDFKLSLYSILAFYGLIAVTMLIRGADIMFGISGWFARFSGQSFGFREAEALLEGIKLSKSFGVNVFGVNLSVLVIFVVIAALSAGGLFVIYKFAKKSISDFVIGYANRLTLANVLLAVAFVFSLIFRKFSIAFGFPSLLIMAALLLNNSACVTLAIGETGGLKKPIFYLFAAVQFVQMALSLIVMLQMSFGALAF